MGANRRRLDVEMARRGIVASREHARAEILSGRVLVAGAPAQKAARLVAPGDSIHLVGPGPRYVSRGGFKLEAALEHFAIEVENKACLDAGASTGGFTDCLLQHGASEVTGVDVGHGQIHERLRADKRVTLLERKNIRHLDLTDVQSAFSVVVADLSFISLRTVGGTLVGDIASPGADVVLLVKPQFEAGRQEVSKGKGVIRDPEIWARCLQEVTSSLIESGASMMGAMASPLKGADGNVEFLLWMHAHRASGPLPSDWATEVAGNAPCLSQGSN